jgi:hypothetical protein
MNILRLAHWLPIPNRPEEARREYRFARRPLVTPFDLVHVSSSSMMLYAIDLDLDRRLPVVAAFGEVDSEWWAQSVAADGKPLAAQR